MIFTRDFVTRENYWQIASLVTQKSLFMVTHVLFFMGFILCHWTQPAGADTYKQYLVLVYPELSSVILVQI